MGEGDRDGKMQTGRRLRCETGLRRMVSAPNPVFGALPIRVIGLTEPEGDLKSGKNSDASLDTISTEHGRQVIE